MTKPIEEGGVGAGGAPPMLYTERTILRDFTDADRASLLAYRSHPRIQERTPRGETEAAASEALLVKFLHWSQERPRRNHQLAIALREDPATVIGTAGLRTGGFRDAVAEFGIELDPAHWGEGLAAEVGQALLAFASQALDVRIVFAVTDPANARITRLLERLGFHPIGEGMRGPDVDRPERGWLLRLPTCTTDAPRGPR